MNRGLKIYAFWEPKDKVFPYLKLCMKTWDTLGYEIVLLDYTNLSKYLDRDDYDLLMRVKHHFSLLQIGDAIRVMLLNKYQTGIWMDCDTIITGGFKEIEKLTAGKELAMVGRHIGFIYANHSRIIHDWYKELVRKMDYGTYRRTHVSFARRVYWALKMAKFTICGEPEKIKGYQKALSVPIGWDYLGNSIVDTLIDDAKPHEYCDLTAEIPYEYFVPESMLKIKTEGRLPRARYQTYYFEPAPEDFAMPKAGAFIYLHNSWTPDDYKQLSEEQVLADNRVLSRILKDAVDSCAAQLVQQKAATSFRS
jgi:hypothetical protein